MIPQKIWRYRRYLQNDDVESCSATICQRTLIQNLGENVHSWNICSLIPEVLRIYFGFQSEIVVERVFRKRTVEGSGENWKVTSRYAKQQRAKDQNESELIWLKSNDSQSLLVIASKICMEERTEKADGILALVEEGANLGFRGLASWTNTIRKNGLKSTN